MLQVNVQWLGHSFFKLQSGNLTVAIDPYDPSVGLKPPRFNADILLITHDHYDHNNKAAIMGQSFVIYGPGEYEIKGCAIYGIPSYHDPKQGSEKGINTIYRLELSGIRFVHLGDLGQDSLTDQQIEVLDGVDVLMVPVGGKYTLNANQAVAIIEQLDPRIIIPMHYKIPGLKIDVGGVEAFVKALGLPPQQDSKLRLIKKDLRAEDRRLIILEPSL